MKLLFAIFIPLAVFFSSFTIVKSAESFQVNVFYDSTEEELRLDSFVDEPVKQVEQTFTDDYTLYSGRESLGRANLSPDEVYTFKFQGFARNSQWTIFLEGDLIQGEQTLYLPYYPHAQSFTIVDPRGSEIRVDTTQFSQCNQNQICEYEGEETRETCPSDCDPQIRSKPVNFSSETQQTLQEQNGVIRNQEGTVLIDNRQSSEESSDPEPQPEDDGPSIVLLIAGIGLIVGAGGLWIFFQMKK